MNKYSSEFKHEFLSVALATWIISAIGNLLFFIVLMICKAVGSISWEWIFITMPLLVQVGIAALLLVIYGIGSLAEYIVEKDIEEASDKEE